MRGIDVSSYQGRPDWKLVAADGVKAAVLRIAGRSGKDTSFEHNYEGCRAQGIQRGVYRYSYALTQEQAAREAKEVLRILDGRELELGIWLDLEEKAQRALGKKALTGIASAFRGEIQRAGYPCGVYCSLDWYRNVLDPAAIGGSFWIARYPAKDDGTMKETLRPGLGERGWQYSSKGRVRGIRGNVDLSVWNTGAAQKPAPGDKTPAAEDREAVKSLQEALRADGITGIAGRTLQADGVNGKNTSAAIRKLALKAGAENADTGTYAPGSSGETVKWLQMRLNTVAGDRIVARFGKGLSADGRLGTDTRTAIGLFQESRGIKKDYIAGADTVTALLEKA
ncbi:MAG: GH25 family lysozyme [Eubacteriales bacterium]|nr:GH25 family lysozyme [Eubacteriales bacterium]